MTKAAEIARMIDHALLKPDLTVSQVQEGCGIAREYGAASVCVRPCDVALAAAALAGSGVLATTVIGFPHGSNPTAVKVFEAEQAIRDGASELDMVINIGRLLSGDLDYVAQDIQAVVETAHAHEIPVKVILENCYLTDRIKERACLICEQAGADFVKTSTGFGPSGATLEDLALMRRTCGGKVQVKAAGGIRTLDQVLQAKAAGAARIGTSATAAIIGEARQRETSGVLDAATDKA